MAIKSKKTASSRKSSSMTQEEKREVVTRVALASSFNAAAVITEYGKPFGELDVMALADALAERNKEVSSGDMRMVEAMLIDQAHALQAIFMNFARRTLNQKYQKNFESFMRMALKAQNQCRMTLETLATVKNPPVVIARQANIANGPQQVNNGIAAPTPPPARTREEKKIQSNELLTDGMEHGPKLDIRGTAATGGTDPAMATLEQIDRPANGRRKG